MLASQMFIIKYKSLSYRWNNQLSMYSVILKFFEILIILNCEKSLA